jgi:hypothetical protein
MEYESDLNELKKHINELEKCWQSSERVMAR